MEAIGEVLKIFAEKHLIPSIFSFVLGTIIYLFTPDESWIVIKLTKIGYWLFLSGCAFIIVQLIVMIKNIIIEYIHNFKLEKSNAEYEEKNALNNAKKLWDYVDSLSQEERELLHYFLKNNNQPYIVRGYISFSYGSLFDSRNVLSQNGHDEKGNYTKYILEDSFYNSLVASTKLYGKISRFDEEV